MVILNGRKSRSGPCYGTAPEQGNSCYKRCSGAQIWPRGRTHEIARHTLNTPVNWGRLLLR